MKMHTVIGYDIIGGQGSLQLKAARLIAREHHERWDGIGYPDGKKGNESNSFARIVAIANVFDALNSKRSYKEPRTVDDAAQLILGDQGNRFDPDFADAPSNRLFLIVGVSKRVMRTDEKGK